MKRKPFDGNPDGGPYRFKLIACEILFRELGALVASSPNRIDLDCLPKGLHDIGRERMSARLAEKLAAVREEDYDAVLLGYALCGGGIVGLSARSVPLIVPRAHDCITLFLGSRKRYLDYFHANGGTYFQTTGWIERADDVVRRVPESFSGIWGSQRSAQGLIERFGEENGRYLWDRLTRPRHYSKLTFIETGVEPDGSFEDRARRQAEEKHWAFETISGDPSLLRRLLNGPWNDDFLILRPGERIECSHDDDIIRSRPGWIGPSVND